MSVAEGSVAELAPSVRQDRPVRRGAFLRMYRSEMRLVLGRRRNQALLVVLAAIPLIIGIAVRISAPEGGEGPQFLGEVTGNGLFLVFTALTAALPFFLPLVVGVVSADLVAGEAGGGTLRYVLTVPVTRGRLLAVKSVAGASFALVAVLVVALTGLVTGAVLFGLSDVTLLSGDTVSLGEGLVRALGVAAYVVVGLLGLVAGGLFISTLTENAIAAMASTVALAIVFELLDAVPQLSAIHPYLLTHHWLGFGELLRSDVDLGQLVRFSLLPLAWAAVFLSLAWARLTTKDVTS